MAAQESRSSGIMKKKRHIEITAVRRITVVTSDEPAAATSGRPPQNDSEEIWSSVADLLTTKQANSIHAQLQSVRSPEARELTEALVERSGDTAIATKQRGLGRKEFCLKLRRVWARILKP